MGLENAGGTPTEDELAQMKAVVAEAMESGAMGICASRSSNHRSAGAPSGGEQAAKTTTGTPMVCFRGGLLLCCSVLLCAALTILLVPLL